MRSLDSSLVGLAHRLLLIWIAGLVLFSSVVADTEIRNFRFPLPLSTRSIHPSTNIVDLSASTSQGKVSLNLRSNVSSDNTERWYSFSPHPGYTSWTVRLSWPGSSPTRFNLEVLPSPESGDVIVHIAASQLSPRFPRHPFSSKREAETDESFFTPLDITIEPLLLGVLPMSTVPALGWMIVFGLGAASTVPSILRYLERISFIDHQDGLKDKGEYVE